MKSSRSVHLATVVGLTAILWVVPSLGSKGMGTVGERFVHVDRDLVETSGDTVVVQDTLVAADTVVEAAIPR